MYAGCDFSVDGLTVVAGVKIAGIKLVLPWTGVETKIPTYDSQNPMNALWDPLKVIVGFLASSYLMKKYIVSQKKKEEAEWL